ncbi:MAG: hypothetical protein NT004_06330 [Bacteroidetes bacterium]|nr:hypothetical protein [Bacteroidota bacterium]
MKITLDFNPNDEMSVRAASRLFQEHIDKLFGEPKHAKQVYGTPLHFYQAMVEYFGHGTVIERNHTDILEVSAGAGIWSITDALRTLERLGLVAIERSRRHGGKLSIQSITIL